MRRTSEPIGVEAPLAELRVELAALDAVSEWRRCGMTADFAAKYFACASSNPVTAASVLATVINELVENAVRIEDRMRLK